MWGYFVSNAGGGRWKEDGRWKLNFSLFAFSKFVLSKQWDSAAG